jgi:hypothetical protein
MFPVFKNNSTILAVVDEEGDVMIPSPEWKPEGAALRAITKANVGQYLAATAVVIFLFVLIMRVFRFCIVRTTSNHSQSEIFIVLISTDIASQTLQEG